MKRITLLLCCLFSLQAYAQCPSKNVRAANCIMIMNAVDNLDVPLYLDSPVNSSRTYSWYLTTTSFGVKAKASDTPYRSIDCQYNQGHLTSFKVRNYNDTYSIKWDGNYISHITAYDSNGSIISRSHPRYCGNGAYGTYGKIDFGILDILSSREPKRFRNEFLDFPYPHNWGSFYITCFFQKINRNSSKKEARGYFYDILEFSDGGLWITYNSFLIETKGLRGKSYLDYKGWVSFHSEKDGRCYKNDDKSLHFDSKYIEEVNINY